MRSLITSVLLASLSLVAASGCAAPTESDAEDGASAATNDPRPSLGRDARTMILSEGGKETAIGSPAKIKAALKSIEGKLIALPGAPKCGPPRFVLTLSGADGKKRATMNACEEKKAFLQIDKDWFETAFAEPVFRKAFSDKPAVGDVLVTATDVILANTEGAGERQPAATFKKGLDLDAMPQTRAAADVPKCMPLMTLRFIDASKKDVATVAVFCPKKDNDTEAPATLTVNGKLVGWVTFDIAKTFGGF